MPQLQKVAQLQSQDRVVNQIQSNIIPPLNQILANPISQGILLQGIVLDVTVTKVNHLLGRKLVGWFTTRVRGLALAYDDQDNNPEPDVTLWLLASSAVTVDIYVF